MIHTQTVGALAPFSAAGHDRHARAQLEQAHEIAPIQGQFINDLVAERPAQDRAGRVHQSGVCDDGHRLLRVARLQGEVDADVLGDLQPDICALCVLEARE